MVQHFARQVSGNVNGPYQHQTAWPNAKQQWRCRIYGKKARDLMKKLLPYMGERRAEKIREVLRESVSYGEKEGRW